MHRGSAWASWPSCCCSRRPDIKNFKPSAAAPQKAVVLTTGNGTTTVLFPASDGNGVSALASAKVEHCAQCEADAAKYFKSGEIAPTCSVCGAKRTGVGGIN